MAEVDSKAMGAYRRAFREMRMAKESMAACEASLAQQRALYAAGKWRPRRGDNRSYQEWRVSALVALGRYREEFESAKAEVSRLAADLPEDTREGAIEAAKRALALCVKALEEE